MFVATGIGPYSGQAVHFKHFAPKPQDYAVNRYDFEAERHWGILDARLASAAYMLGEAYTHRRHGGVGLGPRVPFVLGEDAWTQAAQRQAPARRDQRPPGRRSGPRP